LYMDAIVFIFSEVKTVNVNNCHGAKSLSTSLF
jgi:hypothetical protein